MSEMTVSAVTTRAVESCVERALETARSQPAEETKKQRLHAARSSNFVAAVGEQLLVLHGEEPEIRAFTKHDERNRSDFGMNELLYDVTVCYTGTTESAIAGRRLHYVAAPIWHVESELAKDSRQALFDFNKLVLGAAPLNLFVGPVVHDSARFIDVLRAPAACSLGRVFVALIPHPTESESPDQIILCGELQ